MNLTGEKYKIILGNLEFKSVMDVCEPAARWKYIVPHERIGGGMPQDVYKWYDYLAGIGSRGFIMQVEVQ